MSSNIIGIMSGSSLDGLDITLCAFEDNDGSLIWSLQQHTTLEFPPELSKRLATAHAMNGFDLMQLDADFGLYIGKSVNHFCNENQLDADYIASHGHTVFHEPTLQFTTQIGNGAHIANTTGITTITNFRSADVAMNGQGAPFAPLADGQLFPGYTAYLNLGGIANMHIIEENGYSKARDIGPCNQALNFLTKKLGMPYDAEGKTASTGKVNNEITDHLVAMFPNEEGRPLGLSNELVRSTWIQYLDSSDLEIDDLLASTVEAIAILITNNLASVPSQKSTVLVTGGGAYNTFLLQRLEGLNRVRELSFILPAREIIEYKECALMAYLGYLTMMGKPYPLKHITGADVDTIGGAIHKAI